MKKRVVAGGMLVLLASLGASGRNAADDNVAGEKLNEATPLAAPGPSTPAGDIDADNPRTGLNTQRPDSEKDLKQRAP